MIDSEELAGSREWTWYSYREIGRRYEEKEILDRKSLVGLTKDKTKFYL